MHRWQLCDSTALIDLLPLFHSASWHLVFAPPANPSQPGLLPAWAHCPVRSVRLCVSHCPSYSLPFLYVLASWDPGLLLSPLIPVLLSTALALRPLSASLMWPAWAYCPARHFLRFALSFLPPPTLLPSPLPSLLPSVFAQSGSAQRCNTLRTHETKWSLAAMSGALRACAVEDLQFSHAPFLCAATFLVPTMLLGAMVHHLRYHIVSWHSPNILTNSPNLLISPAPFRHRLLGIVLRFWRDCSRTELFGCHHFELLLE